VRPDRLVFAAPADATPARGKIRGKLHPPCHALPLHDLPAPVGSIAGKKGGGFV